MSANNGKRAFDSIPLLGERQAKPRDKGLSEIVDWGMPLGQLEDWLDHTGEYLDVAKVALGYAALYPLSKLKEKVELYQRHQVKVHPGGLFYEYAVATGKEMQFYDHCHEVGFDMLEISDSRSDWSLEYKTQLIRNSVKAGIPVVAEAGGGEGHPIQEMVDDVKASLEAGAWKVTVDTAEVRAAGGAINKALFDALLAEVAMHDMIFEVWAVPIYGGHTHQIRETELWLIKEFGPEVNIANLQFDWLFPLEGLRRGVGINIHSKTGGLTYT